MKLFLKHVGSHLSEYPQIRFTRNDELQIRDSAVRYLGFENINQLRDRYEGQSFFDKTMKNFGGIMAIQKYLNLERIDINKIDLSDFQPYIYINDERIDIHVFNFGELPLLNINDIQHPIFFVIQKDSLTYTICGIASIAVLNKYMVRTAVEKSSTIEYMDFAGFDHLLSVKDIKINA